MGYEDATDEMQRKTLVMFFLIDVSGSMHGEKIGVVNDAMRELLPDMKNLSDKNSDAIVKLAVMTFAYDAKWETQFPVDFDDYTWNDLEADGPTVLGEACEFLNEKLSRKAFLQSQVGHLAPVIILLSDGGPTDDFYSGLEKLKKNDWFKVAIKAAIGIGPDYDKKVLTDFTGNAETVVDAQNRAILKKMIKFIAVRSSQIASAHDVDVNSQNGGPTEGQKQIASSIQEAVEEAEDEGVTQIAGFI